MAKATQHFVDNEGSEGHLMAEKSTREHLIDVGVTLMHKHGYTATGLTEILESAGVPKGSFYHHFGSKEEFAVAALARYVSREADHCEAVLSNDKVAPLKRLKQYFGDLIKLYGQKGPIPGCMMGRFSLEVAELSSILREHLSSSFGHWQHAIASVIRLAVEQKDLPASTDAESVAAFLLNSWQGALVRSHADKRDDPLNGFMHYAFEVLLKDASH
jgi:TetR/AcrR family transcriptional regulator, transcriptional repressor for nem operon